MAMRSWAFAVATSFILFLGFAAMATDAPAAPTPRAAPIDVQVHQGRLYRIVPRRGLDSIIQDIVNDPAGRAGLEALMTSLGVPSGTATLLLAMTPQPGATPTEKRFAWDLPAGRRFCRANIYYWEIHRRDGRYVNVTATLNYEPRRITAYTAASPNRATDSRMDMHFNYASVADADYERAVRQGVCWNTADSNPGAIILACRNRDCQIAPQPGALPDDARALMTREYRIRFAQ